MADPLDHIERPTLPWRNDPPLTECGLRSDSYPTLTRDEFDARLKSYGQQRTALTTCMTCVQTAGRWRTWRGDPVEALGREVERARYRTREDGGLRLRRELLAIELLIAAHRDEFDETIAGLADTVSLDSRRKGGRRAG